MTISVVLPVRNGERHLAVALESVRAQTLAPDEIVLVDHGSTDRTREIAEGFAGVRVVPLSGGSQGDAFNAGIAAATGTLVAFQSDDDVWLPRRLERQTALLASTGAAGCVGLTEFFLEPGETPPPGFRAETLDGPRAVRLPEALLAERALFERLGGWRPEIGTSGDVDWFARVRDAGVELAVLDEVVVRKRVHGGAVTFIPGGPERGLLEAARASIARKKAGAG